MDNDAEVRMVRQDDDPTVHLLVGGDEDGWDVVCCGITPESVWEDPEEYPTFGNICRNCFRSFARSLESEHPR
jgi:hypothetical protein